MTRCNPEGPAQVLGSGSMRFNEAKCKVLHLGHVSPQYPCRLGDEQIKSCPAEDLMGSGGSEFGHELVIAQKANCILVTSKV